MISRTDIPRMPHRTRRLAAASALLLVTSLGAACADDPAPLFEPEGFGEIEGRLYYDADNNAQFTPVGGDTVLAGVSVLLLERASEVRLDSTTTSASGVFSFADVKPGTHSVFVVDDPDLTANLIFCLNPINSSVYLGELAFLSVPAKLGCVIRIRAAKDTAQGRPVTIAGVVTAGQGTYRGDNLYLQDITGGMQVFGVPAAAALQPGDSVEISGNMGVFNGELQLVQPRVAPNILRGGPVPDPEVATTGEIAQSVQTSGAKSIFVGLLTKVQAVTVGTFDAGSTPRNAPINDGSGAIDMRLDGNVVSSMPSTFFQAGTCYDITGIVGFFNGTPQIKPRGTADVTPVTCP